MSQTKVRVNTTRPTTRRGGRGYGKGFQGQANHSFPTNNEEQRVLTDEYDNKPLTNYNTNKRAFKQARGKAHKKMWSDNSSNTYNEQKHFFEENYNTKLDDNTGREFNKQGRVNKHQQIRNDSAMHINTESQRAVKYVKQHVNLKENPKSTTGDQSSPSNESPNRPHFSGSSTYSGAQTASNSSPQDSIMVQRNASKPPIHAQNPIYVNEIMQRFNSILPPTTLLSQGNPQEISDESDLRSGDETFVSFNVDEVFRHFQNPTQQSNNKLQYKIKKDNFSKECKPFQTMVSDNIRANFPSANKHSQGGREPELKPGPSGYVNRNPNTASNPVIQRREFLKSSGDATNNSSHNKTNANRNQTSEYSFGTVLFAEIDEFESKNKSQCDQINTQTTASHCNITTPGLTDNNTGSNSKTNVFQPKNTFRNSISENASKPDKLNLDIQHPSSKDISQSSERSNINKRDLILKKFGFEGNPSAQNSNFNQEKQHIKRPVETTLPRQPKTNIESGQQKKIVSKSDQTLTPSKAAYNEYKPCVLQGDSVQQAQPLLQKPPLAQQYPDIDKNNSKCFITRSNNTLTQNGSHLTRGKLTGGNVYNIHQPAGQSRQRAITRDESIRRLENGHAIKVTEYKVKQQEKEAKKREERLARYKYVDQGYRLTEGYLDEAVGGQAYIESEEEIRQRQQDQLRRDALVFQEQERKKNEERVRREEENKKQLLEKYKHVSSGQRLGGSKTEAYIESEEEVRQRQQDQLRRDALVLQEQERKKNEERIRREEENKKQLLEKHKQVSSGQRLGGSKTEAYIESEEEIRQRQQDQLRRDALLLQEQERKKNEDRIRREEEQKKQELDKCKQVSSGEKLVSSKNEGSPEDGEEIKMDNSSQESSPTDITSLFVKFLKTSGFMKKCSNGETEEMLSQFQMFMANAKKTPYTQAIGLQPAQPETPESSDSQNIPKKPASCTLPSTSKVPVLVIRPTQEALDHTISNSIAVQDMDKYGQSCLYKPQIEQLKQPEINNRYQHPRSETLFNTVDQWKPQSQMVESKNVRKSLDEIAKSTGAIPKRKPMVKDSHPPDCNSTSSNEPACSEVTEIDLQEEMRAARLRMQKRYDETIRKQQEN